MTVSSRGRRRSVLLSAILSVFIVVILLVPSGMVGKRLASTQTKGHGMVSAATMSTATIPRAQFDAPLTEHRLSQPAISLLKTRNTVRTCTECVIENISVGANPQGIAYDSGKGEVFVGNENSNNLTVISDATNTVVATIPVGSGPVGVAYDSGKGEVFVTNQNSNNVSVISDSTNRVVTNISVGSSPDAVVFDAAMGEIFVANAGSYTLSVISDANNTVVATIPVSATPQALAYDSAKNEVFNTGTGGSSVINVISTLTDSVVANVTTGGNRVLPSLGYDGYKGEVFVGLYWWSGGACSVGLINDTTNAMSSYVALGCSGNGGQEAFGLTYDSGRHEGFVAELSFAVSDVSAFSDTTNQVVANFSVGNQPRGLAYDSSRGEVFVTNSGSNSVSIISDGTIPSIISFTARPSTIPFGNTTNLLVVAVGGTGNLSYAYTGLPPGCTTSNAASIPCTPSVDGNYTVRVYVNDSLGKGTTDATVLIVVPVIESVQMSPPSASIDVGANATFRAIPVCGGGVCTLGETFSWKLSSKALGALNNTFGPSVVFTANQSAGLVTLSVNTTINGKTVNSNASIVILAKLSSVSLTPATSTIPVGITTIFTASPLCEGGTCPSGTTYSWSLSNKLATLDSTSGVSVKLTTGATEGTTGLFVNATLNGVIQKTSIVITILPVLTSVSITPSTNTLSTGATVNFSATPTCEGGVCPSGTTYIWSLTNTLATLKSSTGSQVQVVSGSTAGTVILFLNATLNGKTVQSSPVTITVTGGKSANSSSWLLWAFVGGVVAVVLVTTVLVLTRGRRKPRPGETGKVEGKTSTPKPEKPATSEDAKPKG